MLSHPRSLRAAALLLAVTAATLLPSTLAAGHAAGAQDRLADAPPGALTADRQGGPRPLPGDPLRLEVVPELLALAGAMSTDSLFATVTTLATGFPTRYTPSAYYEPAATRMQAKLQAAGLDQVYLDTFTCCGGLTRHNVVGVSLGTVRPSEIVLVGAHLDCTSQTPNTLAPGAEDNATGSAAVVELARLMAPLATERTLYFVLFGGEEQGLYGSAAFALRAQQQGLNLVGVIVLDMVGYYNPAGADLWLEGFHTGPSSMWLVDLVRAHAQTYGALNVYVYPGDGWGSDHESFHDRGFPAMLSIENEWDSYPCYHRTCDTPSYVNGPFLRRIALSNGTAALELAVPAFTAAEVQGRVDLAGTGDDSGATVTILGTGYAPAVTGPTGSYVLPGLLPGTYALRAEHQGYLPVTQTGVALASGASVTVDFVLLPESMGLAGPAVPVAAGLALGPASPNPFTGATDLDLSLGAGGPVWLRVVDVRGQIVRELLAGGTLAAGRHRLRWDGRDAAGRPAASGVYWVELRGDSGAAARRGLVRLR